MFRKLIKTEELEIDRQSYTVSYFEETTMRGTQRYSSELVLGPADHIIFDGSSLGDVESRVMRLMPATLYSRMLARAVAA
ncbi:MAG: hypothetical protein EXQ48_03450 [Acidobacteria bacterium]|nr:hypothetical protein [Acidobacteriota bacterium]